MSTPNRKLITLALFSAPFATFGCMQAGEGAATMNESESEGLSSLNGLSSINGLSSLNGLSSVNGLSSLNGLSSVNGLSSTNGLITTDGGRKTIQYIVKCALPAGRSISKVYGGVTYTFPGQFGLGAAWENGACGKDCQEYISACVLAHVNTTGQNVQLWMVGDHPALGWGQNSSYPYQEGSFFGNIFVSPPTAQYCNGKDFDKGLVAGRLGANSGSPYVNPFAGGTSYCKDQCTAQDIPNQNDGYKACNGWNHVFTVWRNFDPNTDYKVCNRATGKCLGVDAGSTNDGAKVTQLTYNSTNTSMRWRMVQTAPQQYKFTNKKSGKVMDIFGKSTANGTALVQWSSNDQTNQRFSFTPTGDGFYKFSPVMNGAASLDVPNSATTENLPIQEYTYGGRTGQQWNIVPAL
jgi:hypothetical protein